MLQRVVSWVGGRLGRGSWTVRTLRPVYEAALCRCYGDRGMPWIMNGVPFRIDPRHRVRMGEERVVIEHIRPRLGEGAVCFVLGANAGLYVLQLAYLAGPRGRIVAFEPNPTAVAVLCRHVAMNGFEERVTVVPAAVGSRPGREILYAGDCSMLSRLREPEPAMEERRFEVEAPVVTLDDYCREHGLAPDWITMDIEGFEFAALEGARATLAHKMPRGITAEFHPRLWRHAGYDAERGRALLRSLGLGIRGLTGQSDPLGEFGLVALEAESSPPKGE
ncbi:MAG: FkbM family methyltransferase [Gemmataceae bacterium]|nr:FkbM family methyltransferase [Gemmataceae bacterium]